MMEVIDSLDAASRYFLAAGELDADDPEAELLMGFGALELSRAAALRSRDARAPVGKPAAPRGEHMHTAEIIDLAKVRVNLEAARAARSAQRGASPSCRETLRDIEREFRRRAQEMRERG